MGHVEMFDKLVVERRVRPSLLLPLWELAGYALGKFVGTVMTDEVLSAVRCCTYMYDVAVHVPPRYMLERDMIVICLSRLPQLQCKIND